MLDYSKIYDPDFGYDGIISDETAKVIIPYIEKFSSIIDVGCGTGRISKNFKNNDITLLDQHKKYLDIASKKVNPVSVLNGNFLDIEINMTFDNIFMFGFIHEQENLKQIFTKAKTLMHDETKLFISFPNPNSLHRIAGEKMKIIKDSSTSLSKTAIKFGTLKLISNKEIEDEFMNQNLKIINKKGICFKPYQNEIMEQLELPIITELNKFTQELPEYSAMNFYIVKKIVT